MVLLELAHRYVGSPLHFVLPLPPLGVGLGASSSISPVASVADNVAIQVERLRARGELINPIFMTRRQGNVNLA